jgi:hypothetical protein
VKQIGKRLTYANIVSSLAIFLVLGGAAAFAASTKIGSKQLKANAVTAGKIKKNAVASAKIRQNAITTAKVKKKAITTAKIAAGAVTNEKLGEGAVNFAKIAAGTSLIATANGSLGATNGTFANPADIPLSGTTTFTPPVGVVDQLNVEVRGNLTRTGTESCGVTVVPYVNGNPWLVAEGFVSVSSASSTPSTLAPNGFPLSGATGPIGLTSPGAQVTLGAKLAGDATNCTSNSTVAVVFAVTQLKKGAQAPKGPVRGAPFGAPLRSGAGRA